MCKILITEDERIIAEDIRQTLLKYGHDIVGVAASGEEAITLVEDKCPDIILMDIMLAGDLNGIETVRYLNDRFQIPVIYLTAYADETTMKEAFDTDPVAFILKPFKDKQLFAAVEMAYHKASGGLD